MADLFVLIASVLVSGAVLTILAPRSRWWRLAAIPIYALTLGLAMRFCGRTYPGVWVPNNFLFLNDLLNGNGLFVVIGYCLVLALALIDVFAVLLEQFRIFSREASAGPIIKGARLSSLIAIGMIVGYGLVWALMLRRLPDWTYG